MKSGYRPMVLAVLVVGLITVSVWAVLDYRQARTDRLWPLNKATGLVQGTTYYALTFEEKTFGVISYSVQRSAEGLTLKSSTTVSFQRGTDLVEQRIEIDSTVAATDLHLKAFQRREASPRTGAMGPDSQLSPGVSLVVDGGAGEFAWRQGSTPMEYATAMPPGTVAIDSAALFSGGLDLLGQRLDFQDDGPQMMTVVDPQQVTSPITRPLLLNTVEAHVLGLRTWRGPDGKSQPVVLAEFVWPTVRLRVCYEPVGREVLGWELPDAGITASRFPGPGVVKMAPTDMNALGAAVNRGLAVHAGKGLPEAAAVRDLTLGADLWVVSSDSGFPANLTQEGQAFSGTALAETGAFHVRGEFILRAPNRGWGRAYDTADGTPLLSSPAGVDGAFLAAEPFMEADSPAIRNQAQAILGDAAARPGTTRWQVVRAISSWVYRNIRYQISFGTALETLHLLAGDCAPHSYLTVAFLRSVGVPARPVTGLALNAAGSGQHVWVDSKY